MRKHLKPACIVLVSLGFSLASPALPGGDASPPPRMFATIHMDDGLARKGWIIQSVSNDGNIAAIGEFETGAPFTAVLSRDRWQGQKSLVHFKSFCSGNGKFVAVGEAGAVGTSTDGAHWRIHSITTNCLTAVAFFKGQFAAAANSTEGEIWISKDALAWQPRRTGIPGGVERLEARAGSLFAFTARGEAFQSTDLVAWVTVTNTAFRASSPAQENGAKGAEARQ
jgi:hypothetical protein